MSNPPVEAPLGLALVVCDTLIEDKRSGKKSLIGLFDQIFTSSFPCVHQGMDVYISVTGGRGEAACELVCRHGESQTVAFSAKGKIKFPSPNHVVELVFQLRGVRFAEPGVYWLHFLADEAPVMGRPLFVRKVEPRRPPAIPGAPDDVNPENPAPPPEQP